MVAVGDNGFLVNGADGLPIFFPFGADTGCEDGNPSLYLTVSGGNPSDPTKIQWADRTWLLPLESGVEKLGCPQTYSRTYVYDDSPTNSVFWEGKETWSTVAGFKLRAVARSAWVGGVSASRGKYQNYRDVYFDAVKMYTCTGFYSYYQNFYWSLGLTAGLTPSYRPWTPTGFSSYNGGLTVMTDTAGAPNAVAGGYRISEDQMGNHTQGGFTFSWRFGNGW